MATPVQGLTPDQRRALEERGLVRVPGVIPRGQVEDMADQLWSELTRKHGIRRRDPGTWRTERPADFKSLQARDVFKGMASPRLVAILDDLLGRERWVRPRHWGQPLVCFPRSYGRWDVPHQSWHLDLPADPRAQHSRVGRMFAILAPLAAKGGGTLVVTGSHRIVQTLVDERGFEQCSGEVRKRLKAKHRWFRELMSSDRDRERIARFMNAPTEIDGVAVQVEEMTGEPGDLFLMHPAALHAAAPNALAAPRLVLAQFVYPKA
jgi:ectoine hydroxylase-related dioxygenase (phytanoyl-CoA dioxygenase family)